MITFEMDDFAIGLAVSVADVAVVVAVFVADDVEVDLAELFVCLFAFDLFLEYLSKLN